jgi:hypothetical protein
MWLILGHFPPPKKNLALYTAFLFVARMWKFVKKQENKNTEEEGGEDYFVCMFGFQFQVSNFEFMNRYI